MIWNELEDKLADLEREGLARRRRVLETPCGPLARVDGRDLVSFCSNDYLGLASDPALIDAACAGARRWGVGGGASHLVSGHFSPHETLEEKLAAFTGFDRALLFSTGYMANLGIVGALAGRGDAIFADRLNHASLIDAARLSRADHERYPHGDLDDLERRLAASDAKRKLILTDAVFSMDGDIAPLPQLLRLAERFDTWLVIDDAHGFGVLGEEGRGSLSHFGVASDPRVVYMGTLGKAAGASGAFAAGSATVIEWLLQRARTYIFTTGASPIIACALLASLELIRQGEARRQHLRRLADILREGLSGARWRLMPSPTAIQPIVIGDNHETVNVAQALRERGLWVPAIRPPTVPRDTARLRVSLSAAHDEEHVRRLVEALRELG
ncbi:MAG: 8-amino-7-oxononanoate synthase [Candidatus Accumulibacter sp.]|jgi:8-amino-7-oxononanoate synthase|nr:8-amino-7-oxononanoate synthase [Accumulibacter sp.]